MFRQTSVVRKPGLEGAAGRARTANLLLPVLLMIPACSLHEPKKDDERPSPMTNVVFILIDDLGWSDLPSYGNRFHETPHLDRLAREGVRFAAAYAAAPVCSPTRASIFSGQYPARLGVTDFIPGHWRPYEKLTVPINRTQYLPLEVPTFAELMQRKGYATGYFGKWHLGNGTFGPDRQGFGSALVYRGWGHFELAEKLSPTVSVGEGEYLADVLTEQSLGFLRDHAQDPFFLTLAHFAVHIPLEAPEETVARYREKAPPENGGIHNAVYAAMIEHVDKSVGRILDLLEQLKVADRTAVLFFSDNGGLRQRFDKADDVLVTSNSPLRDEKGSLYEGGIRVPFLVRWPGVVEGGTTIDSVVTSVDFYPTLLEIAGIEPPADHTLDGKSLLPLFRGEKDSTQRPIYFHYPHYHHSRPAGAIRQGDFKLIEFFDTGEQELYDLGKDVGETRNLVEELPEQARSLEQLLALWRTSVGAEMPSPNSDYDRNRHLEWGRHPGRR